MKKLVIGILAHVDAGKTTLAEGILFKTGSIRKAGRVDHKNTFLDTYELERERGITIFSKQAVFSYKDIYVTLLDTPGHVDFSAEMERTLQVLDYAIVVINGSDGVQGHTETLWSLLARYRIPAFIFINKMDLEGTDRDSLMENLKKHLSESCIDFNDDINSDSFQENIAVCDEAMLNSYLEKGSLDSCDITEMIADRKIFPCYFGSALRLEGVDAFLDGLASFTKIKSYPESFGARIYKIARDEQGNRLTYMKITGGRLKVKTLLSNNRTDALDVNNGGLKYDLNLLADEAGRGTADGNASEIWEEKVDQIRIYSGVKYETVDEADAGTICAVTGLSKTYPGEGLGIEVGSNLPLIEPVLNYQLILPQDCSPYVMFTKLLQLEEEEPQLHIAWNEKLKEIHVQLMGEIQLEVLKNIILERFGVEVEFGPGNIMYKETILEPVIGVGHYEPLRHYAEVHLLLEPAEAGSGLQFYSKCSEDMLDRNWQRAVLTHLEEKEHIGVLIGAPITDMRIILIAGRAHLKHTDGGDFRQATYRAVRQGLKKAKSVLLEPYYRFRLELPADCVGRAMTDINRMNGSFKPPELTDGIAILSGTAPVATMRGYQMELTAYTRGKGRLFCVLDGYKPCHNADEVIEKYGYDSEGDIENPTSSIFCAHGAGFVVEWNKVEDFMHIDNSWHLPDNKLGEKADDMRSKTINPAKESKATAGEASGAGKSGYNSSWQEDKELEDIFIRTFGPIKDRRAFFKKEERKIYSEENSGQKSNNGADGAANHKRGINKEQPKEYLLVDGYNIIFSWDELNELAKENMDAARYKLMDMLCNYQGYKSCIVILVFDAYKVKGGLGEVIKYNNIHVVYTKEAETADDYIEKVTHDIAKKHFVRVATSDALEQLIIMGQGAIRLSAADLKEEIKRVAEQIRTEHLHKQTGGRNYIREHFDEGLLDFLLKDKKDKEDKSDKQSP